MYRNYGDKNFFENGVLVDTDHSDTAFPMLLCRPYPDARYSRRKRMSWTGPSQETPIRQHFIPTTEISL